MGGGHKFPEMGDEFNVLVTGLGPYPDGSGGHYQENDNTSHLITQHLPAFIPASSSLNSTGRDIRFINPTAAPGKYVKSEYAYIRQYMNELWDEYGSQVDVFLHLGMADGWEWYTVEERAYREGFSSSFWGPSSATEGYYLIEDDVGRTVKDISDEEGRGKWKSLPMGLETRLDIERMVAEAQDGLDRELNGEDAENEKTLIKAHHEAGSYCCGFVYYESLAQAWSRESKTKVMFTHVPGWKDDESLERGAAAVCAIAAAICAQVEKRL